MSAVDYLFGDFESKSVKLTEEQKARIPYNLTTENALERLTAIVGPTQITREQALHVMQMYCAFNNDDEVIDHELKVIANQTVAASIGKIRHDHRERVNTSNESYEFIYGPLRQIKTSHCNNRIIREKVTTNGIIHHDGQPPILLDVAEYGEMSFFFIVGGDYEYANLTIKGKRISARIRGMKLTFECEKYEDAYTNLTQKFDPHMHSIDDVILCTMIKIINIWNCMAL